jgi:hypothetical protein
MSTPTETTANGKAETTAKAETTSKAERTPEERNAELAADLARLETVLDELVREQWAPRLPPAGQLPRVPGLLRPAERFPDNVGPPPAWLTPAHMVLAPETDRGHAGWPLAILVAALCGLPLGYSAVVIMNSMQPTGAPQLASVATKRLAPPSAPSPTILARDDSADLASAGDHDAPAIVPHAPTRARETVAMLKSDDRVIATPRPEPIAVAPKPGVAAPEPEPVAVAPAPKQAAPSLDPETITLLLRQGEQLAEAGDFAAARTLLQRAAAADDAAAATALGATYDPGVLARMGAVGIDSDAVKARFWYMKAASLGSADAKRRLEQMANR